MNKKTKAILILAAIPLVSAGLTMGFRFAAANWLGYVPILECPGVLDLGEWNCEEVAIGRFRIKNNGKRTLTAKDFLTSCSCVKVERQLDGKPSRVQTIELSPGEEVELSVSMGIGVQPGESQLAQVLFQTNDPARSVWQMDVIIPRVGGGYFAHPSAVVFGTLGIGDKPHRTIDLFNNRVADRQVESVRSSRPDRFRAKLLPLSNEDKQRVHRTAGRLFARIEVTPCSEHPGPISGEVTVSLVKESHRTPPIPVLGEVVSSVVCRPAMLVLPWRVRDQLAHSGEILISHRREKPIEVALDALPPEITAEVKAVEGRSDQHLLHIEWHPRTNSKGQSTTEKRLRVRVRADGEETKLEIPIFLTENRS